MFFAKIARLAQKTATGNPVTVESFNLVDLSIVSFSDCLEDAAGDGIGIAL